MVIHDTMGGRAAFVVYLYTQLTRITEIVSTVGRSEKALTVFRNDTMFFQPHSFASLDTQSDYRTPQMKAFTALLLVALLGLAAAQRFDYTAEALKDEIVDLPDAPKVNWRQFGGYINVAPGRRNFYWYVEAQSDATNKPLIFWTNGGPGCSGLIGKLTENGPFVPHKNGTLTLREYGWNKLANIVFMEQPSGVGFSRDDNGWTLFGDDLAATDNLAFVRGFFAKFPQYNNTDFYLASESYGGHYLPTLALKIVKEAPELTNFRGFFVGNPLTYMPYRDFGEFASYADRQLIPRPEWDEYIAAGCRPDPNAPATNPPPVRPAACSKMESKFSQYANGFDPYALDFPVCNSAYRAGLTERRHFLAHIRMAKLASQVKGAFKDMSLATQGPIGKFGDSNPYFPDYDECSETWATNYLNRKDVQKALHADAPQAGSWQECANINWNYDDEITAMMPIYKELISRTNGKLRMTIISGDDDAVCSTQEAQLMIWNLGLKVVKPWGQWYAENQIGGMKVKFEGLTFQTIHGAGHMAPATRPMQTFHALKDYLDGK